MIAFCTPAMAESSEEPSNDKILSKNANDITFDALEQVKTILATAITASDLEKSTTAVTKIKGITKKIIAIETVLKATPMPTAEEKKAFARKMLKYESQVSVIIKKMTNTFENNTEETNKIIEPAMTSFQEKIKPTIDLINIYYPREEMDRYMNELKEQ